MSVAEAQSPPGFAVVPGGFWIRAAARLIDWIVQALVGMIIGVVMAVIAGIVEAAGGPGSAFLASMERTTFIGWIGGALAALGYHSCFEGIAGTTVGKRLLSLQVLSTTLAPIDFGQAMKRSIGFLVDALFFGAIGAQVMSASPLKQRIGDNWAETCVVRRESLPLQYRTPTMQVIMAFVMAMVVTGFLVAATQIGQYLWLLRGA